MTIRAAVYAFMDQQDKPRRFCITFIEWIAMKYTQHDASKYVKDVNRKHVTRCIRDYSDISGATLKCVNRKYGVYYFTPGVKVGKAIVD